MPAARHSVSVAAAVTDNHGRFLVIQRRDNGRWEPPGGILELHETVHEGLIREVREETGLTIAPDRLTGVYKNMTLGVVALVFRAHITAGTETTSDETTAVAWWTTDQITDGMPPAYATRLLDAHRTDGPAIRSHDGTNILDQPPALPN